MHRPGTAVLLVLAVASPLAAQERQVLAAGPRNTDPPTVVSQALHAAMLRPVYQVRLVSDWPQLSAGGLGCVNGGQEVLEGKLRQTSGGDYSGRLVRRATIRFCGVHGGAAEACALTLTSAGTVAARGVVTPLSSGWAEPRVELRWFSPEGDSEAVVEGDCPAQFNESVRRMYLAASHSVEFALPTADEGPKTIRVEDYGWLIDIR